MARTLKKYIWIPVAAAGVALIIIGAASAQAQSVLKKAVMICLECIGIG